MSKRPSSKARRRRPQILELRVHSPRIFWIAVGEWLKKLFKLALIGGVVAALVWAASIGLRRAFLENDDFRVSLIDLNPNPVLDELGLIEIGGIDLEGSIFAIDIPQLEETLAGLPGLASARVERELPGTLRVRVRERVPVAWLEMPAHGIRGGDPDGGLMCDRDGVVFPCPDGLAGSCGEYPVIVVGDSRRQEPQAGRACKAPELHLGLEILQLARGVAGMEDVIISRIEQASDWSVLVETGDGIEATIGLSDHRRQFADLVAARRHAERGGYRIASIDLIPERNIPITLGAPPPPRAVPVDEPEGAPPSPPPPPSQRDQDLNSLLNRG